MPVAHSKVTVGIDVPAAMQCLLDQLCLSSGVVDDRRATPNTTVCFSSSAASDNKCIVKQQA
jgi:hypothetical protein